MSTIQGVDVSWDRVRDLFTLEPSVAHLNHGSFGAVPIPVQRAQQRLRDEMDANPMAFFSRGLNDRIAHVRRYCAAFVGADPEATALVTNATAAAQTVLGSLTLKPGDEILLTNHGYETGRLAAERVCTRTGATIAEARIPLWADDDEVLARIVAAAGPRTRVAVVDQITSPTARLFPVARIVAALHERGIAVLVDAAHAPGLLPVDVSALRADFWFGNLHKWAFAPRPAALLAVAPAHYAAIEPLIVSHSYQDGFPDSLELAGTLDYTAGLAAPTGLHVLRTLDPDRVRRHNADLVAYGQRVVGGALGSLDRLPDPPGTAELSMRLVALPAGVADDVSTAIALRSRIAADLGCEVAVVAWGGHGYLRLSAQIYNTAADYDRLAVGLPSLLAKVSRSMA
jgi:isopenicillin-N epimerase